MAAKAGLFWDNLCDLGTLTVSSEASVNFSKSSLLTPQLGDTWRSNDVGNQYISCNFGEEMYIPHVFLMRHNLTAIATVRIRISNNSDMSNPVYDVTHYAWPSIEGYDQGLYDGSRFVGYDGAPIVANLLPAQKYSIFILTDTSIAQSVAVNDGTYSGQYLRLDILDESGSITYYEAGYLAAGQMFEATYDIDWNNNIQYGDASEIFVSYGQTLQVNVKNKPRRMSMVWSALDEGEARANMALVYQITGSGKPCIAMQYVENSFRSYATTIYGILEAPGSVRQIRKDHTNNNYVTEINIRESL